MLEQENADLQKLLSENRIAYEQKLMDGKADVEQKLTSNRIILEQRIANTNDKWLHQLEECRKNYSEQFSILDRSIDQSNQEIKKSISDINENMGAVARQTMLAKWKAIDESRKMLEGENDTLTRDICGCSHKRKEYRTLETDCIFNGGHLVWYICPECGVIFGPSKFIAQGQKGIDEDYWVHYLGFSEDDSSYKTSYEKLSIK